MSKSVGKSGVEEGAHRRAIKSGEALAIAPDHIRSDGKAMWWDFYSNIPNNERVGDNCDIAIVHIRGSLEHHCGMGGDSYEDIVCRFGMALNGDMDGDDDEDDHGPVKAIILRIDSPGGVVSGLNETVYSLRKMARDANIKVYAFVDELAASAAYAMACAASEIALPPSAIAGSIGVISTMYDQTVADDKMGLRFVTLTSGARKDDGHPHVPISDAALSQEQRRVGQLAKQFYRLVAKSRPMTAKAAKGLEAGIFLGQTAVDVGLADAVMTWDELVAHVDGKDTQKPVDSSGSTMQPSSHKGTPMLSLVAQIKKTEASLAKTKDKKEKAALTATASSLKAALEAYKKTKHMIEKHETEEGEDEDEDEEEDDESGSSEESKGNETDRKEEMDDDDKDEDDDDDDEDDEDEKKSSKKAHAALASFVGEVTGKKGRAGVGALAAMLAEGKRAAERVDQIEKERRAEKKGVMIDAALNARRITRHEAKTLREKPISFVEPFLAMRPKAIINVDDETIRIADPDAKPVEGSGLSAEVMKSIDIAAKMSLPDGTPKSEVGELRKKMIDVHMKKLEASTTKGRY